jgi:hypothetical protein
LSHGRAAGDGIFRVVRGKDQGFREAGGKLSPRLDLELLERVLEVVSTVRRVM